MHKNSKAQDYNKTFLNLNHECQLPSEEDVVLNSYPGTSLRVKLKRFWIRSVLVDETICKTFSLHLRSHGAIILEKKRHMQINIASVHPYSKLRIVWEIIMIWIIIMLLIALSFDLAYYSFVTTAPFFSSVSFLVFRTILDLFCCADVVINARTGYYDPSQKQIVLDSKTIFMHYFKGKFFLDFISSFPTHWDLFVDMRKHNIAGSLHLEAFQIISLLKYLKFAKFTKYTKKICNIFNVNFYLRNAFHLAITSIVYWHGIASLQMFGSRLVDDTINIARYMNTSFYKALSHSLYDGALILYNIDYGVDPPTKVYEFLMTNILWVLSKFGQIYFLACVMEFLKAQKSPKYKYNQMMKQLVEFMRHKRLPLYTQKRILKYYDFHFQGTYFRETEIYAAISGQLRQEILMQTCKELVQSVAFFSDLPMNLLVRIVSCLKSEVYLTNDVIIKAESVGNCMYFIQTGTVAIYSPSGKEICHLWDGAHFGEVALVSTNTIRIASVVAVEICELYRLDRNDFIKAVHPYPDLLEKIQKIAAERMETTMTVDQHTKGARKS